ncbi:MAG: hypothetical protein JNK02_12660 [Planctomycetes bacterium]|nr:hypothetical protein [Planctomycetota bacterium]
MLTTILTTILTLPGPATAQGALPPAPSSERPRDPFVFRCVLDGRVRMVTLALHDELWAAWDAQTCALYKTWKGGVKFDGAVYTTVHGPTPTTRGEDYQQGLEGGAWFAYQGNAPVEARARWRGYRLEQGACVLQYDIELADGRAVRVEECPEFATPERLFTPEQMEDWGLEPGLPGLVRRYHAPDVPAGLVVGVLVRTDAPRGRFIDAGGAAQERLVDLKDAKGQVVATEIHSLVWLDAARKRNSLTQFFDPKGPPPAATAPGGSGGGR